MFSTSIPRPYPRGGFHIPQAMIIVAIVAVLLPLAIPIRVESSGISPASLIDATNAARMWAQVPNVEQDILLTRAAQIRAVEIAATGRFEHLRPDGSSFASAVTAMGYPYARVAENLAINYLHGDRVIRGWLTSLPHREQLLRSEYRHVGIGIATGLVDGVPTTVVVELLGSPGTVPPLPPSQLLSSVPTG